MNTTDGGTVEEEKPTTRVQEALRLENVPPAKYRRMMARTIAGFVSMALLTAFLLRLSWLKFQRDGDLSLTLIGGGVFCGFVCGQIASGQIVGRAVASLAEPLRVIREFWKGPGQ